MCALYAHSALIFFFFLNFTLNGTTSFSNENNLMLNTSEKQRLGPKTIQENVYKVNESSEKLANFPKHNLECHHLLAMRTKRTF